MKLFCQSLVAVLAVLVIARLGLDLFDYMTGPLRNHGDILSDEIRVGAAIFCISLSTSAILLALLTSNLLFHRSRK